MSESGQGQGVDNIIEMESAAVDTGWWEPKQSYRKSPAFVCTFTSVWYWKMHNEVAQKSQKQIYR